MVMDRTGWLWRRKPSDNSPGASDSSVPVSSHPQCCSGDQEVLRPVSNNASAHHGQSPKVSSRVRHDETQETGVPKLSNEKLASRVNLNDFSPQHGQSLESYLSSNGDEETKETMKSLNEKLAAALLAISEKEDLVKQHAKVTEEAVAGWEQAEVEATAIKKLLEAASHRNDYLEGQVSHLDKALKECVRQLRLVREEQEEIIRDALTKKSQELESENSKLQNHIAELKKQLAATKSEASTVSAQPDLQEKLQTIEKDNLDLKAKLLVQSKDLKILSLEKDLSNQAAETASKQHLESIKKIARVEAECRRLHHLAQKTALVNDSRPPPSAESLTDSHSDSAECMVGVDSELRNSDSWASALITELDQFRNAKASATNIMNNPVEIDLMDDFLEMERLAALPESDQTSSTFDMETDSDKAVTRNNSSKIENEELRRHVADLHSRVEIVESDKKELEIALIEARNQLDISCDALVAARNRLVEMQMQLDLANDSKYAALGDVDRLDSEKKALEFQLESKSVEAEELHAIVASLGENAEKKEFESQLELVSAEAAELRVTMASLEERIETETALSVQHKEKSDAACNAKELLETQLYSANAEVQKLHGIIKSLENQVEEEKALRDELMIQSLLKIEAAVEAVKEPLEAQLCSANTEVEKLRGIIEALESEIEKERTVHEELTSQLDMKIEAERTHSEAVKESLEGQLCSANSEVAKLRDIIKALENEVVEKEKALHEKLAEKAEKSISAESVKESLEAELQLVNSEVVKLRDMVTALEHEVVKEKEFSDELQLQLEALEAIKRVLESEVESAHQDARKLKEKVELFEAKLDEQMSSAAEFTAKEEAVQSQRTAMEHQLEASKADVVKLTNMVSFLQGEVVQERLLSEDYEQKCRKLEAQLSRDIRDAKLWRLANSNGDLKTKQEKELASAAGKLAECQKTIASLGRQLKSLTEIDNVVLEPGLGLLLEPRDIALDLRASDPGLLQKRSTGSNFAVFADELYDLDLPDGDVGCFSPLPSMIRPSSPPPSEMSVFAGGLSSLSSYRGKRRK
ncbi:filament-like plant protein 2 [Triticum dicoccoides]|uniref:Filament-like plant protein n=1 Tax=Triticum turgidum subsp. durum TaxID=4567 RepID=A0A9R0X3K3_TRITD|nr:filament-like plant protein 2 [Triticum dicoccoides]XP_037440136.1 filament-like plant protein 2 [Triticum dicoccoides]XP_037440137.1 filament-like plant protein 2 [Triticum dicoccoides]VAI29448.1 unnamed protein product [Triticum turgidum subsp. durum]